jgi:hypothetical protein
MQQLNSKMERSTTYEKCFLLLLARLDLSQIDLNTKVPTPELGDLWIADDLIMKMSALALTAADEILDQRNEILEGDEAGNPSLN